MNKKFHIAFGVDERFMHPMGVTITSIIENNPELEFTFHVFTPSISGDSENRLKRLEKKYSSRIVIHVVDQKFMENSLNFPTPPSHVSLATYMRLLMSSVMREYTDRVLYLDADIVCVGSISELTRLDIENEVAMVIHDVDQNLADRQCSKFSLRHGKYFNAGVIYINIDRWIEEEITEKALKCISDRNIVLDYADQDALNIVLDGMTRFIDKKWNYQYRLLSHVRDGHSAMNVPDDAVFIHFIGPMKPWRGWNPNDSKRLFLKYHLSSSWSDLGLDDAMNYKEQHVLAKYHMLNGRFRDGVLNYLGYLKRKYI